MVENEKCTLQDLEMAKKLKTLENEKNALQDINIWRETFKNVKNEKKTIVRKLNNAKNEIQTLKDLEYGEKTENHGK